MSPRRQQQHRTGSSRRTRTGAMPSAAGTIRPTAARNSRAPMALRVPGLKSSTHLEAAPPIPASFSLGTNTLVLLATRKTTARIPATIHRARFSFHFMRISLTGYRQFPLPRVSRAPPAPIGYRCPSHRRRPVLTCFRSRRPAWSSDRRASGAASCERQRHRRKPQIRRGDPDDMERARPRMHNDGPRRS